MLNCYLTVNCPKPPPAPVWHFSRGGRLLLQGVEPPPVNFYPGYSLCATFNNNLQLTIKKMHKMLWKQTGNKISREGHSPSLGPSPHREEAHSPPKPHPLAALGGQNLSTAFQFRDVGRYGFVHALFLSLLGRHKMNNWVDLQIIISFRLPNQSHSIPLYFHLSFCSSVCCACLCNNLLLDPSKCLYWIEANKKIVKFQSNPSNLPRAANSLRSAQNKHAKVANKLTRLNIQVFLWHMPQQ